MRKSLKLFLGGSYEKDSDAMGGGIAACAIAIVLAACSNPEYDGRTDTVYSLSTPSVTAKAYPGVNIVSWKPVSGAKSYKVCVYEEGALKDYHSNVIGFYCADTNLVNGKNYKYTVEAVGERELPAREVYVTNSSIGEASAKAIVPPAGTSALELAAYEKGYDGSPKEVKDDNFVVSAENVEVYVKENTVYVNLPTKAYLSYNVCLYNNDLPIDVVDPAKNTDTSDAFSNNVTRGVKLNYLSAGKYKVVVEVNARNDIYKDAEIEVKEITIDALRLDAGAGTGSVSATYLSDNKTARVSFIPARKDGAYVPASWYTVYRRVKGEYETTKIGSVSKLPETNVKYFVDDTTIADTKKAYEYIVVVGNDGKYGYAETANLEGTTCLDGVFASNVKAEYLYTDHFSSKANNLVRISFTPVKKDGDYVPTSWYKVYRSVSDNSNEKKTEVTSADNKVIATVNTQSNAVVYYVTDTIDDPTETYKYFVVAENDGKYSDSSTAYLSPKTKNPVYFDVMGSQKTNDTTGKYEGTVIWSINSYGNDLKKDEIKSITLCQVKGRDTSANLFADEATTEVKLANLTGTYEPYEVSTTVDLDKGSYVYLVVKAERDGNKVTYKSVSVQINKQE